jgi:hypothetical protein
MGKAGGWRMKRGGCHRQLAGVQEILLALTQNLTLTSTTMPTWSCVQRHFLRYARQETL